MTRDTLKILHHLLQAIYSMSDHFEMSCTNGVKLSKIGKILYYLEFLLNTTS